VRSSSSEAGWEAPIPLLVHVAPHLFVGFGPWLAQDLVRTVTYADTSTLQNPSTRFGASVLVGLSLLPDDASRRGIQQQ